MSHRSQISQFALKQLTDVTDLTDLTVHTSVTKKRLRFDQRNQSETLRRTATQSDVNTLLDSQYSQHSQYLTWRFHGRETRYEYTATQPVSYIEKPGWSQTLRLKNSKANIKCIKALK